MIRRPTFMVNWCVTCTYLGAIIVVAGCACLVEVFS